MTEKTLNEIQRLTRLLNRRRGFAERWSSIMIHNEEILECLDEIKKDYPNGVPMDGSNKPIEDFMRLVNNNI
jgi:hypothetical protein